VIKKRPVPWYYWPWWMVLLAIGLFIFYVLFTPVWMGIRLVSWLAERFGRDATSAG
jgi:Flp pilus assembly protein protease CpaA